MMASGSHILIVEARFYSDITDSLVKGAVAELTDKDASYERLIIPGILEIPAAIRYVVQATAIHATSYCFSGYVVLGCAIKGETHHYEHICREAMSNVQHLTLQYSLAVGNGILTCPTRALALCRADPARGNRGGSAAAAALRMIQVKHELGL